VSTQPLRVYQTPHVYQNPHVYPTSTCLLHFYMSTLFLYVYSTSTCLPNIHMSTQPLRVYPTPLSTQTPHVYTNSTCLPHLHMSTPPLRVYPSFTYLIQFRTHGEFENENTFCTCTLTAEREKCVAFWSIKLLVLLDHCVTWESESEGGFMKIYWQWENVRVQRISMGLYHLYEW